MYLVLLDFLRKQNDSSWSEIELRKWGGGGELAGEILEQSIVKQQNEVKYLQLKQCLLSNV